MNHRKTIFALAITLALASLPGCASCDRQALRRESEYGHGVERTVRLYSEGTGELLGEWSGCIDVEIVDDEVDMLFYDGGEVVRRVITEGGIVTIESE